MTPGDAVRRWQPPRLAPEAAAVAARLSRRRVPARGAGWAARVVAPPERVEGAEAHALTLAGAPAVLEMPGVLVQGVLSGLDPAAPGAAGQARRLLLELALEGVAAALEGVLPVGPRDADDTAGGTASEATGGATGADETPVGVDATPVGTDATPVGMDATPVLVGLECRAGGGRWTGRLRLSEPAAAALAAALEGLAPAPVPPPLLVALRVRVGACELPLRELRGVRPGDVLLGDVLPGDAPESDALVVAEERWVWQGRRRPGEAVAVLSARVRAAAVGLEGWMMGDETAQPPLDAELDDLPVRLVFEAGRVEVPLGELGQVGPGHVFALPGTAGTVDILANGRRIGQGELVQVGDAAGVRVLRLHGVP